MRATIALVALVAGCEPTSHDCPGGWVCPGELACAAAPVYCGVGEQVDKCAGKAEWDACEYTDGSAASGSCRAGVCELCTADREGCAGPTTGWFAMTSPVTSDLMSVIVLKQGEAYAVGQGGAFLGYDGTQWKAVATTPALPTNAIFVSVWASGSDDIYIASGDVANNVWHVGAGGAITAVAMPAGAGAINAIAGTGAGDVYAVGASGTVCHYDGSAWTLEHGSPGPYYNAVAAGTTPIVAGNAGYVATAPDWTPAQPLGTPAMGANLYGAWQGSGETVVVGPGTTTNDPATVGYYTTFWAQPTVVNSRGRSLFGVWGAPEAIYAVGDHGLVAETTDRASWFTTTAPTQNDLRSVSGSSATDLIAVGRGGSIVRSRGD
jgi:hypothetical protein